MLKLTLLSLLFVSSILHADPSTFVCPGNVDIMSTTAQDLDNSGYSGGIATFDSNGNRIIKYDKQLESEPEVMNHIIAHECAHHKLRHVGRHIENYYASELLQEQPADCLASKMLVDQLNYGKHEFDIIGEFLSNNTTPARARWVLGCAKL